jgi:hypothetical protein
MRPGFQTSLSASVTHLREFDPRLKAFPRGLRPLRYSFAPLRMTFYEKAKAS